MALNDHKLIAFTNSISSLSTDPSDDGVTAAQLKAKFDARAVELQTVHNSLIEYLKSSGCASEIGAGLLFEADDSDANVQAKLEKLKAIIDSVVIESVPDDSITAAKLKADCVTVNKILDATITAAKLSTALQASIEDISPSRRLYLIESKTLASDANSVTFSSIPAYSGYLIRSFQARKGGSEGAVYGSVSLVATDSVPVSKTITRAAYNTQLAASSFIPNFSECELTKEGTIWGAKTIHNEDYYGSSECVTGLGNIVTMVLAPASGQFWAGSIFKLYGIKEAE